VSSLFESDAALARREQDMLLSDEGEVRNVDVVAEPAKKSSLVRSFSPVRMRTRDLVEK
jgi:hypothetical protein